MPKILFGSYCTVIAYSWKKLFVTSIQNLLPVTEMLRNKTGTFSSTGCYFIAWGETQVIKSSLDNNKDGLT